MTYSNVRSETHHTRDYLVYHLTHLDAVTDLWDDGSDLVVATLHDGQKIMFYLIESPITAHEIQKTLRENTEKGIYTLFLLWAEMLVPRDGTRMQPEDWVQSLLALYGDRIYTYEVSQKAVYLFPAHYKRLPNTTQRIVRWGKTVSLKHLRLEYVRVNSAFLNGDLLMAHFQPPKDTQKQADTGEEGPRYVFISALQAHYEVLEVHPEATAQEIRTAYRNLARQYHPDINNTPEALAKMQAINDAYNAIMKQFDG